MFLSSFYHDASTLNDQKKFQNWWRIRWSELDALANNKCLTELDREKKGGTRDWVNRDE